MKYTLFTLGMAVMLLMAACSTNQGTLAGRVNGVPIPRDEYIAAHRGHFENFWVINDRAPGIDEKQEITRQTWRNITKHVILQQHFQRYNISSSVAEALDTLKANPPAYIVKSPVFQSKGSFDRGLYQQSLLYGQPEDLSPLVRQYRDYYVPVAKLREALIDDQLLTPKERKAISAVMTSTADLELVWIDASQLDIAVRDEDIKLYYDTHQDEYRLEPSYSLAYTFLPLKASRDDIAATDVLANSLYFQLKQGARPDSLILAARSAVPLISWKESGFLKIDDLDPGLYSSFTAIESGAWLPPIHQTEGVAIHRLEQLTKSLISFSTIFLPYLPGQQSIAADLPRASQSARLLRGVGYAIASEELDLDFSIQSGIKPGSKWLDADFVTPESAQIQQLGRNYVPEPVFYPKRSAWLLIQITDLQLQQLKPLNEVRDQIYATLASQNRRQFAYSDAQAWLNSSAAANVDVSGLASAQQISLKAQSLEKIDVAALSTGILYNAMLRKLRKQPARVYQDGDLVIIPLISSITGQKSLQADPQKMRTYFRDSLSPEWFNYWMEEQIKKARVSIFMDL